MTLLHYYCLVDHSCTAVAMRGALTSEDSTEALTAELECFAAGMMTVLLMSPHSAFEFFGQDDSASPRECRV